MRRFNVWTCFLLLLAASFIASAFIPDFWIMVNYNLIFFLVFFSFGILNKRPLLIFLGLAFLSPYVHDLLDLDFAQWNLFSGIFLIGLALEFLYGNRQKKGLTKDYKVNKNDQEGPHISVKTYMAEDRYRIYSQEVETVDLNMAFGELWLDLSQASFASSQVAVHLDAKFGEVHIRLPHGCVMDTTGISHLLSSIKVDHFESDLEQVETRLDLTGGLLCTELTVEY
ncbi:hypothetical protein [Streptococcus sp.]|uniref:hypothetical protein n=1 Tax=Streptococcus sp. TaxID=1306 RepID=UPI0025FE157A|nr:hypothetical protein [Streptococcus sp.]